MRAVVSDLHVFSPRTNYTIYEDAIKAAITLSDTFILNGDIIDFHWHREKDILKSAMQWLSDLITYNPKCRIIYILGNHDCSKKFTEALDILKKRYSNFDWSKDIIQIEDSLFFHGDLLLSRKPTLVRSELVDYAPDSLSRNYLKVYETFVDSKLHHIVSSCLLKEAMVPLAYKAMEKDIPNIEAIKKVYFGHIHNSFADYNYKNILFTNTGSALKNGKFNMSFF